MTHFAEILHRLREAIARPGPERVLVRARDLHELLYQFDVSDAQARAAHNAFFPRAVAWKTTHPAACLPITEDRPVADQWRAHGWPVVEFFDGPSERTVSVLRDLAALKRYDSNKGRGSAGMFFTLNVPVALAMRLDMAVQREDRAAAKTGDSV